MPAPLARNLLLLASNLFMTMAWYGHLRFKSTALWIVILASCGIAFFEYVLQVPANRIGHGALSAAQLKTSQDVISLTTFAGFRWLYLGERMGVAGLAGFALIAAGTALVFLDRQARRTRPVTAIQNRLYLTRAFCKAKNGFAKWLLHLLARIGTRGKWRLRNSMLA